MWPNFRFPTAWLGLGLHQTTQYLSAGHDTMQTTKENLRSGRWRKLENKPEKK
jgi:hypothetical protein